MFQSAPGIQRGDAHVQALLSLAVDEVARVVESGFDVWFLDEATLVDSTEKIRS